MTDIVERLRDQGKDAFAKHYSLGMFKLCADAADEIERLRNAAQSAWQPIETAPTDGTSVLIGESDRGSCGEAYFEREERRWYWANTAPHDYPEPREPFPTHWMPMPQAPALSSAQCGGK